MTDDLVKRLRNNCSCNFESTPCGAEEECRNAFEAADRIEQQERYLAEAQKCLDEGDYEGAVIICRAALGERHNGTAG